MTKAKVDANIVREFLLYDVHEGRFYWRERRLEWFKREKDWKIWNKRFAGKQAGCINTAKDGYCQLYICIFGMKYTGAQLTWLWMYGDWPTGQLTYADGNSLNLRIDNLLEDLHGKARRINSNNRSGVTGVRWHKQSRRWVASPSLDGKPHYLGSFTDFSEAEAVVSEFYREHGFLPRHGKPTPIAA